MERLIDDYSKPKNLVCDPCAGAGTTLVAALKLGRRAIGCDAIESHAALAELACESESVISDLSHRLAGQAALFERSSMTVEARP
jgi:DNA modification methylase